MGGVCVKVYQNILWFQILMDDNWVVMMHIGNPLCNLLGNEFLIFSSEVQRLVIRLNKGKNKEFKAVINLHWALPRKHLVQHKPDS